jgi:sugar-specific transcriptional regulator TrmB
MNEAVEELMKLGFTEYQAKVFSALTYIGPSGASEISRASGVPRTKVYEILEELVNKQVVEYRRGRPTVYRALPPFTLTKILTQTYLRSAQRVERLLEEQWKKGNQAKEELVWTVRGEEAIKRKLSELLVNAKRSIFILEVYPPSYITSLRSQLKSACNRGVGVKAVCVVGANRPLTVGLPLSDIVEYRSTPISACFKKGTISNPRPEDETVLKAILVTLSHPYAMAVVDETKALVVAPNPKDKTHSLGFSISIPAIPVIMKSMAERALALGTRIR